jgi:hypothetical protein
VGALIVAEVNKYRESQKEKPVQNEQKVTDTLWDMCKASAALGELMQGGVSGIDQRASMFNKSMGKSKVWYDTAHESSLIIERQEDDKLLATTIVDKWKSKGPDNKNLMSNSMIAGACIACKKDKCYADIMLYEEKVVKAEVPITCAPGTKLDDTGVVCLPICTCGKVFDAKTHTCIWATKCTGEHQVMNETDGKCIC